MKILMSAVVLAALCGSLAQADRLEVMHFWVSESESAALDVFASSARERGNVWLADPQPGNDALMETVSQRFRDGVPPTAAQWSVSPNMADMLRSGLLLPVNELMNPEDLGQIAPVILEAMTFEGELAAIPVGLHGNNWSYYNADIMARHGFTAPDTWDAFFAQMQALEDAGQPTIAIGRGVWEQSLVLDAMIIDAGGEALLSDYSNGDINSANREAIEAAYANFITFAGFVRRSGLEVDGWSDASLAVGEGRATVQIMGDWAKGELVASGFEAGQDFLCAIAPGRQDTYLVNIDAFVLPYSEFEEDQRAQAQFVEVVLDPVNQAEFSRRKGNLPATINVAVHDLDVCGQLGHQFFHEADVLVLSSLGIPNPGVGEARHSVLTAIWTENVTTGAAAASMLIDQLREALGQN